MSAASGAGRYAPSPSGDLHVGNLRTALLAWLFARSTGRRFLLRFEDLDRVRPGALERQLSDLESLGIDWDGTPIRQSDRMQHYRRAVTQLSANGQTYECFCTRREIQEAPTAPHGIAGEYPGTCRDLSDAEREHRRRSRPAALRLRADVRVHEIDDGLHGTTAGRVDDLVLVRNDGVPAYNLAVVVDDAAQGFDQVVRGDDLLASSPRQAYLAELLGLRPPAYAHVPLAVNAEGARLSKRDGAVTLADLASTGVGNRDVLGLIADSLGFTARSAQQLLAEFDPALLPRRPWVVPRVACGQGERET